MRLTGMLVGINLVLPTAKNCRVTHLNGDGDLGPSFEVVRKYIRGSRSRRQVVGAINDVSAIGALRAFEEAGRADTCAVMGQNASPEGRAELRVQPLNPARPSTGWRRARSANVRSVSAAPTAHALRV